MSLRNKLLCSELFHCSAVDHFKKQFAYLEEHYGNGAPVTPPERQHASLPRYPC